VSAHDTAAPRLGVVGCFDDDSLGSAVLRRVVGAELSARMPTARLRWFAPLGALRPTLRDEGRPAEPLLNGNGDGLDGVVRRLAGELDALLVCGRLGGERGAVIARAAEGVAAAGVPVAWELIELADDVPLERVAAQASAVDAESASRLRALGATVTEVPRAGMLLGRHIGAERLAGMGRFCELAGWLGDESIRLLVDGNPERVGQAVAMARHRESLGLVIIAGSAAEQPEAALPRRTHLLPWYAGVEVLAAVVSESFAYCGDDPDIAAVSAGFAVPTLDRKAHAVRGVSHPRERSSTAALLEGRFAAMAEMVVQSTRIERPKGKRGKRAAHPVAEAAGQATTAIQTRLSAPERRRAAEHVRFQVALRQLELCVVALEVRLEEIPRLEGEVHALNAEMRRITGSRTWRYTSGVRRLYGNVRGSQE
jgi:hypothetical protein